MSAGNNSQIALVLFGPPGSGKGTQAKILQASLGIPHVSTGDMLREHVQADDEIGREVKAIMQSGRLVPDDLVNRLIEKRISRPDTDGGVLLDGYPRTLEQADKLTGLLRARGVDEVVVHLRVDYNKVIARLSGRRQCPKCGTLYNLASNPPKTEGVCDQDGTRLIVREDDQEPVIRQRLEAYERQTRPVLDYFARTCPRFYEVEGGDAAPETIAAEIRRLVGKS
jgi:adenylate kinase